MNSVATDSTDLRQRLQDCLKGELAAVNEILQHRLKSSSDIVSDITEHVSHFKGKQVRPMLLMLWQRMLGGSTSRNGHMLAAAVEMIHMATLVHDDVIDESETRRHVATVHRRWNTETSVLFGDYLFSRAFHLAASTGDAEACRLIGLATDRTCEGELNQTAARLQRSRSERDYFRIIRDKTGQLFGLSCLLGSRCANLDRRSHSTAQRFGFRLGQAFQITDDILDLTEIQETTGKDAGNDLANHRLTLPLLRALQLSNDGDRKILEELFSAGNETDYGAHPLVAAGIKSAHQTAVELVRRAQRDLQSFADCEERQLLHEIANFSVGRKS